MNAWRSPTRIGQAHTPDQRTDLMGRRRPSRFGSALPGPVQPEALVIPCDYGFWLDDLHGATPAVPNMR